MIEYAFFYNYLKDDWINYIISNNAFHSIYHPINQHFTKIGPHIESPKRSLITVIDTYFANSTWCPVHFSYFHIALPIFQTIL